MDLIPFPTTESYFNGTRTARIRADGGGSVHVLSASEPTDWATETLQDPEVNLAPIAAVTLTNGSRVTMAELQTINASIDAAQVGLLIRGFDLASGGLQFEADSANTDLANSNQNLLYRGLRVVLKDLRFGPDRGRWYTPGASSSPWSIANNYIAGAVVSYTDGSTYLSLQGSNLGNTPGVTGSVWWVRADIPAAAGYSAGDRVSYVRSATTYNFASLKDGNVTTPLPADYNAGTAYVVGDQVFDAGLTYVCILAGTGHTPASSASYWLLKNSEWWTPKQYKAELNYGSSKLSYVFVYTLVNDWNEEGPPSDPVSIDADYGQTISLHGYINLTGPAYANYRKGAAGYRFRYYGFVADSQGSGEYRLIHESDPVGSGAFAGAFGHWVINKPADWQDPLPSVTYDLPPAAPLAIASGENGMLGIITKDYFSPCEPFKPWAWPADYRKALSSRAVGLLNTPGGWLVTTQKKPRFVAGPIPEQLSLAEILIEQGAVSQKAMCSMGERGLAYASNDGIVIVQGLGASLASGVLFTRKEWRARYASLLSKMRLAYHDGRLVCLFPGTDQSEASNYQGFIIRFDDGVPMYSRMSITGSAAVIDTLNDQLLIANLTGFYGFEEGPYLPLTWQSKEFIIPKPENLGAAFIEYTGGPLTVDVHADGANVYTKTCPYAAGRVELRWRLPAGFKSQRWSIYIAEGVPLAWDVAVTYRTGETVTSGGVPWVAIGDNIAITPGTDPTSWTQIGGETVHRMMIGSTMTELSKG